MKMVVALIIPILCCFFGTLSSASESVRFLGSCDYYDSLSSELGCSSSGYLQSFGAHYCRRFDQEAARFSERGREALDAIRLCLQQSLENVSKLTCGNVLAVAAESHGPCYRQGHFCEMNIWDKVALMGIVFPALLDPTLNRAIRKIESDCLSEDVVRGQNPDSVQQTIKRHSDEL